MGNDESTLFFHASFSIFGPSVYFIGSNSGRSRCLASLQIMFNLYRVLKLSFWTIKKSRTTWTSFLLTKIWLESWVYRHHRLQKKCVACILYTVNIEMLCLLPRVFLLNCQLWQINQWAAVDTLLFVFIPQWSVFANLKINSKRLALKINNRFQNYESKLYYFLLISYYVLAEQVWHAGFFHGKHFVDLEYYVK